MQTWGSYINRVSWKLQYSSNYVQYIADFILNIEFELQPQSTYKLG